MASRGSTLHFLARAATLGLGLMWLTLPERGEAGGGGTVAQAVSLPRPAPAWERDSPLRPLPTPPASVGIEERALPAGLTPEKVRLGRWLFFDPRLSVDGTVACASCHRPEHGFSEPAAVSTGVRGQLGTRKAPPTVNLAHRLQTSFFWDGRAASLAEQALGPITNPVEMANTLAGAERAVRGIPGYRRTFHEAYGDDLIDSARIAEALAAYQATLFSGDSTYDRWQTGDDEALSPEALAGMELFFGPGRCSACHLGPNFTDGKFHNAGVGEPPGPDLMALLAAEARRSRAWAPLQGERLSAERAWAAPRPAPIALADAGRYLASGRPADMGAFKTPSLRDLPVRAPYMHDGSSPDLEDAVLRYLVPHENPWLDEAMREVQLEPADVKPLVAFLRSLQSASAADVAPPSLPE